MAPFDVNTLIREYSNGRLSDKAEVSNQELTMLYENYVNSYLTDERVYSVFASLLIERGMFNLARSCLYARLYLLEHDCADARDTLNRIKAVDDKLVADILPLPKPFVEKLFLRDHTWNFSTWKSKMKHTEDLLPYATGSFTLNNAPTTISATSIKPGDLLMKTTPLVVAPWTIDATSVSEELMAKKETYCCFHCLSVVNKSFQSLGDDKRLIACPKHPRECSYHFCSRDCFMKNGAIHAGECDHLIKLQKISEHLLNPALVLLVCRTLIKCSLNMDNTCRVSELDGDSGFNNHVLDSLLNFEIDYGVLNLYHSDVLEQIDKFTTSLLDTLGFDFCLHLTSRELAHITLVLWFCSIPIASHLNYSCESAVTMGGVAFSFNSLRFKQSHNPNCVLHFDDSGKITVRAIYEIPPGSELTVNTFLDKYLPPFIQIRKFWSVRSLFSETPKPLVGTDTFKETTSIRCSNCVNSFCHATGYRSDRAHVPTDPTDRTELTRHYWECEKCNSPASEDLDLLQNKAQHTFEQAQTLYFEGDFLSCKGILQDFVTKWSGVLHPSHYLMYNAHLLLSGMLLNRPGGNVLEALTHFRAAIISADGVLPRACHERAYLYDRFADSLMRMKTHVRLKNDQYNSTKAMVMDSLYNALWNWTVISGTDSYHTMTAMQKCRRVAFALNIHTFPLSSQYVVHVPNKYANLFRAATGCKVVPKSFTENVVVAPNTPHKSEAGDTYAVADVAAAAFRAAHSGEFSETILDVLTTVHSHGISHLGTGLSLLGIVASNLDLEFFNALLESIYNRLVQHLDFLSNSTDRTPDVTNAEECVANLLDSVIGANELGISTLTAIVSTPHAPNPDPIDPNQLMTASKERTMLNTLFGYCNKFHTRLKSYATRVYSFVVSVGFHGFLSSDTSFTSILITRPTHPLLGSQAPLHYASSMGKTDVVDLLVNQGANVDQLNIDGATPLHLAAYNGHTDVTTQLVKLGANFNIALKTGETPLHLAVYGLHRDTVAALLAFCKDLPTPDVRGPSVWHALVCGIFHFKNESEDKETNSRGFRTEQLVARLSSAVEISNVLMQETAAECLMVYPWANFMPSQLLGDLWNRAFDKNSLFNFPKKPPSIYVVSQPKGVMERPLKTITAIDSEEHIGIYGSLKESKYDVNNYSDLNERNDGIFSATRAFHSLFELLKGVEEHQYPVETR